MEYLNSLIQKWMPNESKVQVDSHPRLSGIMDTINSTLAHGPETRLPSAFYDSRGLNIIEEIGVEEWFAGFQESNEYRTVGIGGLAGDIVARMVGSVEKSGNDGLLEVGGEGGSLGAGRGGEKAIKFGLSGCHDTTLAAILASLGCFQGEKWPPYTSHIAFELFREANAGRQSVNGDGLDEAVTARAAHKQNQSRLSTFFSSSRPVKLATEGISRKPVNEFNATELDKLKGHYVRIRYNDQPLVIPGCRFPGKHLDGDESFCTLVSIVANNVLALINFVQEAFKAIVDKFTPHVWKKACTSNIDEPAFPAEIERAGF